MANVFVPADHLGGLQVDPAVAPLPTATWYVASREGDGLTWTVAPGALTEDQFVTCDFLLDGCHLAVFLLRFEVTATGQAFDLRFSLLNQCQARLRLPLRATDQNAWLLGREGACLKVMCGGDRIDPRLVDRVRLTVIRRADEPVRWCQTPLTVQDAEPPVLTRPLLPAGPLLDALGQSTLHAWPQRTPDEAALVAELQAQDSAADAATWPATCGAWGGAADLRFEATGFFRREHTGGRWWLVDPAGHAFWSAGCDCVDVRCEANITNLHDALTWLPAEPDGDVYLQNWHGGEAANYLAANFQRAFGAAWAVKWERLALAAMRRIGFNTVGNWSRWEAASRARFPFVRPLEFRPRRTPLVFRDFPDLWHPDFAGDCRDYAAQLEVTRDDAALIGYFLMNEPKWGFAKQTPAEGMLLNYPAGPARDALVAWLRERYSAASLAAAWGADVTFDRVARGRFRGDFTPAARADLTAFSEVMATHYFEALTAACRAADPHHLNLGARYYTIPPDWALEGMACFDVFSLNSYSEKVNAARLGPLSERLEAPIIIGEWHFGALDVGLPASGIGRVKDQAARGQAYRVYLEDAAAQPWCVGVHWFTLYDQSALGRFDGENYNIGLLDLCHRAYEPLEAAARVAHEVLYRVARGQQAPYADAPEYLPRLF